MTPATISLVLLSALFHALWNFCAKSSKSTQIFFFWIGIFTLGVTAIAFAIRQPLIPREVWIYIIASGVVHFGYWFSLSRAYTLGEISFVYPIARSAPAFIPLFALLFLGETISMQGLIGIVCVVFSIYLFQQRGDGMTFRDLLRYMRQPDSIWAFSTLGTVIAYSLIDKQGMAEFHAHSTEPTAWRALIYYLAEGCIALVLYNIHVLLQFSRGQIVEIGRQEWRKVIASGSLAMTGYTIILYLFMTEKVSYIIALRQCSVIFAVLLRGYALKESRSKLRLAAAILMVFGMFLITTAG